MIAGVQILFSGRVIFQACLCGTLGLSPLFFFFLLFLFLFLVLLLFLILFFFPKYSSEALPAAHDLFPHQHRRFLKHKSPLSFSGRQGSADRTAENACSVVPHRMLRARSPSAYPRIPTSQHTRRAEQLIVTFRVARLTLQTRKLSLVSRPIVTRVTCDLPECTELKK